VEFANRVAAPAYEETKPEEKSLWKAHHGQTIQIENQDVLGRPGWGNCSKTPS